jgi:hypothetical protein
VRHQAIRGERQQREPDMARVALAEAIKEMERRPHRELTVDDHVWLREARRLLREMEARRSDR